MSEYISVIKWIRPKEEIFTDGKYSRGHTWSFDGGAVIPASSSPHVVPLPYSVETNVDPEEAFVASISSCHMLFFLSIAAKQNYVIDEYTDKAAGFMEKDSTGKSFISKVILRPEILFSGEKKPSLAEIQDIHHQSHELCYIANSVRTDIEIIISDM